MRSFRVAHASHVQSVWVAYQVSPPDKPTLWWAYKSATWSHHSCPGDGAAIREDRVSGYYNQPDPDDFENEAAGNNGGGLRKMLEETLAENKKLLAKLEERERGNTTADLLKGKGLDPAIAELIPADQDPAQWVEKYAHLLGVPQGTPATEPAAEPEIQLADDSDPALIAEREALAAMQDAAESGSPAVINSDALERMSKINSEAELLEFFKTNGAVGG